VPENNKVANIKLAQLSNRQKKTFYRFSFMGKLKQE